jgi:hypothetical protein
MYLTGNNATAFYRYGRVANTWTTMTVRPAAAVAGVSLNWPCDVSDPTWGYASNCKNGRFLYSFRGGVATLDIYDIALGTWTTAQPFGSNGETFAVGTSYEYDGQDNIIIALPGSTTLPARLLRFDVIRNGIYGVGVTPVIQGTGIVGDKLFSVQFQQDGVTLNYMYHWKNSGFEVCRVPMWHIYNG